MEIPIFLYFCTWIKQFEDEKTNIDTLCAGFIRSSVMFDIKRRQPMWLPSLV